MARAGWWEPEELGEEGLESKYNQVFVIGGQSNAAGAAIMPESDFATQPNVILYNKNEEFELSSEPAGRRGENWINNIPPGGSTSEPTFFSFTTDAGKAIAHYTGLNPVMVPCAIGSTSMQQWAPPAIEDDMTTLFGAMTARTKTVNANVPAGVGDVPAFLWFGHEANSGEPADNFAAGTISTIYMTRWISLVENIRARFPDAPIVYAQLATHDVAANATSLRKAGESQRATEADFGDKATYDLGWEDAELDYSSANWASANTNEDNTVTNENESMRLTGDGSVILEGSMTTLTVGQTYRLNVTVQGTGTWRLLASGSQVGSGAITPGDYEIEFTADGTTGRLRFLKGTGWSDPFSLLFTINALDTVKYPSTKNTYMVVTHDVPRNANPDGYHLNVEGLREVGRRFAAVYAERVLGMSYVNGTGPRLVSITKPSATTVKVKFNRTIQANANGYGVSLATSLFRVYDDGVEKTLASCARDGADDTAVLITTTTDNVGLVAVTYGDRAGPADATWRQGVVYDNDNMPAPSFGPIEAV